MANSYSYSLLLTIISFGSFIHGYAIRTKQEPGQWPTFDGLPPVLFGHTGERFYLPEHTTGSYYLASVEGADYVEPLVMTKDNILVCYHDITLKRSTNIADFPEFANRRGNHSAIVDGKPKIVVDDWLVIHFTLDELKRLRIKQQNEATFQEFLDTVHEASFKLGRPVGIIPELKHPPHHNQEVDRSMETTFLNILRDNGYPIRQGEIASCSYNGKPIRCGPVIFQNFDKNTSYYLSTMVSSPNIKLMTLVHPDVYSLTWEGFREIASFSDYICLWKDYLYTGVPPEIPFRGWEEPDWDMIDEMGGFLNPEEFVPEAHRLGTKMTVFTIPDSRENSRRGCAVECDWTSKEDEMFYFFDMGVDGLFVENVPESMMLRMKYDYELKLKNFTSILS